MSHVSLILTVVAKDKPGIVQQLSDAVQAHAGNWSDSQLSRLGGQFTGIIKVTVATEQVEPLLASLQSFEAQDIAVASHTVQNETVAAAVDAVMVDIQVAANDRPGIVEEITAALASKAINVESMSTYCESASMAGYVLFKADLTVELPVGMSSDEVQAALEQVSDDLMVTVQIELLDV